MSSQQHSPTDALALALALALTLPGCGPSTTRDADSSDLRGVVLPAPIVKADFTLHDTDGKSYDFRERTDGRLTLLFFGYTNCPDICPVHMANLGAVLANFSPDLRRHIEVVFVTTDPERDTPERLRAWLDNFDPRFVGLHGPIDEVNRIQHAFNLPHAVRDDAVRDDGSYLVGHSAQVLAFTPDDVGRVTYPFGTRQVDWAHDLPRLLARDWTAAAR